MTPDLPAYLDAQLAAIEDTARAATPGPWYWEPPSEEDWPQGDESLVSSDDIVLYGWGYDSSGIQADDADRAHIALHDPTFTLAWCAAIRAVIALHGQTYERYEDDVDCCVACMDHSPCPTLRALAQPFAGGDGWQEGWAL